MYWCSTPKRLCFQSSRSFARMATGKWLKANRNSFTPSEPAQKSPASASSPWYSRLLVAGWADCEKEADSFNSIREMSGKSLKVWNFWVNHQSSFQAPTVDKFNGIRQQFDALCLVFCHLQPQVRIQNFWWWFLQSVWPDTETQRLHVYDIQNVQI